MSRKIKKKVPVLRFPEFEGDWHELKFNKLIQLISGQHLSPNEYSLDSGEIPYFTGPSDFTNDLSKITKWTKYSEKSAQQGDILITVKGNGVGEMLFLYLPCVAMGRQLMAIRPITVVGEILYQKLFTYRQQFQALASGNVIPGLSRPDILTTKIYLSGLKEQEKIASFLWAVDTRLTQLRRKHELLQTYKRGVMQKIFSQQIRFKCDDGKAFPDWKEKKLGDLGELLNGLTGKKAEDFGKGKPYITYKQVFDSSYIKLNACEFVSLAPQEKQNSIKRGDILFTTSSETSNEVGFSSVLLHEVEELYLNSFCFGLRPQSSQELIPKFSQYLFRSSIFRGKMYILAQGSTRFNLSKSSFVRVKLPIPCPQEQAKIADFLTAIDQKIEAIAKQIKLTEQFKKGLLQKMFV
ncbi:restriction endonuclease subunit S [Tychonema bourrellyi FEM_GT703]|uniref:Restriction endonuclease subunit S n=1 Tax=Tychonema bourrellyi FEM_GT703 TaxID=2040638 RepID=A0A2G4EZJ0_9CYAN|nr:restriction endonuclease subunit S [Tychonema bourrellyi]PHX54930.1 restriction endonuclease subunit S [Tychonema bourrellyi FEM_GT703]